MRCKSCWSVPCSTSHWLEIQIPARLPVGSSQPASYAGLSPAIELRNSNHPHLHSEWDCRLSCRARRLTRNLVTAWHVILLILLCVPILIAIIRAIYLSRQRCSPYCNQWWEVFTIQSMSWYLAVIFQSFVRNQSAFLQLISHFGMSIRESKSNRCNYSLWKLCSRIYINWVDGRVPRKTYIAIR